MIPRYSRKTISQIWSIENKFKIWTEIECLIAEKLADMGKIPKKAAKDIKSKVRFNVKEIEKIEKETKHDFVAYINNASSYIGESAKYFGEGLIAEDLTESLPSVLSLIKKEELD